jgi:hypothetical protein
MNANDVHANLNGQASKTQVTNFLEELATEKKVIEKVYGKQKIYMASQVY